MKKWIGMVLLLFLMAGCGTNNSSGGSSSELYKGEPGFITEISGAKILVKDVYYGIDDDTEIVTDEGEKFSADDLQLGMKVEPWYVGGIRESYPAQADAGKIVVFTNEESEQLRDGVAATVKYAEGIGGKPVIVHSAETIENGARIKVNITAGLGSEAVDVYYNVDTEQIENE